ncbi:lytic murein transglycosylase B [Sphaerotilus sp.]|uniref:lytic murein transglycosylase B n=1 Tax=Sphaerotilus sp. TaxID=2093942 RepID=UPI002ACE22ED|nr:lytic murein transglycosylase B [Sphaerotilus sp.]MDZ7858715.1 lytic murein transglycosylase B [Sphaerotilus sp.]
MLLQSLLCTASAAPRAPAPPPAYVPPPGYEARADVATFIRELVQRNPELDEEVVATILSEARYQPQVAKFIMPAANPAAKNWKVYRSRFLDTLRVREGVRFWRDNEAWLQQAEARWGVPARVIVAIIGVETIYGRQTGGFRAVDALATLTFDFPRGRSDRSAFFRGELEALFALASRDKVNPLSLKGSYAGALGMPQFMPSTWLKFALDFDGDGRIDLHRSTPDVIGSVARYLAEHGWVKDMATHYDVLPPTTDADREVLLAPDILPSFTATEFAERGATLSPAGQQHTGKLALVELRNGVEAPSFVAGTDNFWAITRYNWSAYYAMAVIDLSESLAALKTVADNR